MKRSQKLTSLMELSYNESLEAMQNKLNEYFVKQPLSEGLDNYDNYLDYLQSYIVIHKGLTGLQNMVNQAKKIILKYYKGMSKGDRFAFLTYLAESDMDPEQKVLSTPTEEEVWQYVFGQWGGNLIVEYYKYR